jgi:hypothetical protein
MRTSLQIHLAPNHEQYTSGPRMEEQADWYSLLWGAILFSQVMARHGEYANLSIIANSRCSPLGAERWADWDWIFAVISTCTFDSTLRVIPYTISAPND